jgi:hypothetical protein
MIHPLEEEQTPSAFFFNIISEQEENGSFSHFAMVISKWFGDPPEASLRVLKQCCVRTSEHLQSFFWQKSLENQILSQLDLHSLQLMEKGVESCAELHLMWMWGLQNLTAKLVVVVLFHEA